MNVSSLKPSIRVPAGSGKSSTANWFKTAVKNRKSRRARKAKEAARARAATKARETQPSAIPDQADHQQQS